MTGQPARHASPQPAIVWFRRDLRLLDNPALSAALASGRPVLGAYILDRDGFFAAGGAQRWFLAGALESLSRGLSEIGVDLIIREGGEKDTILSLSRAANAAAVYWNRRYARAEIESDQQIKGHLKKSGLEAHSFNGALLREPFEIKSKTGGPYRVYTPFWNTLRAIGPGRREVGAPGPQKRITHSFSSDRLEDWRLRPTTPNWAKEFADEWRIGEQEAAGRLDAFLGGPAARYGEERNLPGIRGTSQLSPYLALGVISPLTIWNRTERAISERMIPEGEGLKFLSEIGWREFAYHLLYHNPTMPTAPLRAQFEHFPWRDDEAAFGAWTRGETGVPIIDAGMRELWRTGWMHNRVRMIVASFLVKNLLVPWQKGERWFWETLVDADPANNAASWQWVAGCGADAAPYFRIFNPVSQGEKFDPNGDYVRRFVPELARLPAAEIHAPWKAPTAIRPGDYPAPIIDLDQTRKRALEAYQSIKSAA